MSMNTTKKTKRCHWVSQAYLRAFAADSKRKKIWRMRTDQGEPELKPISKVAVRHHLYTPKDKNGQRNDSFERKLSKLESWFGSPLWRELQTGYRDLSQEPLRKMVSLLAATMFLRTPLQLNVAHEIHAGLVELSSGPLGLPSSIQIGNHEHEIDAQDWPAYRDASAEDIKRMWISELSNATHYAALLMDMRWSMVVSDDPVFITSDNPIVPMHPSLRFRGFRNPETTVMFPISPTRTLMMDHRHKEPANNYYAVRDGGVSSNLLMMRHAIESVFSHRHPNDFCLEIVTEYERSGVADMRFSDNDSTKSP